MTSPEYEGPESLGRQIRRLAEEVEAGLVRLNDYYEHTKAAWKIVTDIADQVHPAAINDPPTLEDSLGGPSIPFSQLAARSERYIDEELVESCFNRLVSLMEHWVFGLLRFWLLAYPDGIPEKDKKPVKLSDILAANDKDEILRGVVEWELLGVAYKRPAEWFKYLRARVNLVHPTDDQIGQITEIKASRDLLIHNQGIVNASYIEKAGSLSRYQVGDRAEVPEPYYYKNWEMIRDLVRDMAAQATEKSGR